MLISLFSTPTKTYKDQSVLHLKFDDFIPEMSNNVAQEQFSFENTDKIGLNDLKLLIQQAANDSKISGILLQPEESGMNPTVALRITEFIEEFKTSGKFVHAYGNTFTQSGYLLAAVADSILLNPNGIVDLHGFGMTIPYLKGFSDKSKIKFDVYYAGKFKSAIEPYYLSQVSDANREQTHSYLGEYQNAIIDHIAEARGLTHESVENIILNASADAQASKSVELGLVDGVSYWEEYESILLQLTDTKKIRLIDLKEYWLLNPTSVPSGTDRIAVVYAEGEVAQGGEQKGSISMDVYNDDLDRIKKNDKIKAVVLRVNSPGGSAVTSDLFWKKVEDLKKAGKYVVASFGTYAASGGYYISCGADQIVSEPTTLTGSIGVYSMIPDMSDFFKEQLGVNWDTIGTGKHAFMYSIMVPRSDADHAKLMSSTEQIYAQFLQKVADGRGMTVEAVNEIAQGRVWSGRQAVENGLVDTLGTLDDAIAIAAAAVGTSDYKILQYPVIKKTIYEELINNVMSEADAHLGFSSQRQESKIFSQLKDHIRQVEEACQTPQARLPFSILE